MARAAVCRGAVVLSLTVRTMVSTVSAAWSLQLIGAFPLVGTGGREVVGVATGEHYRGRRDRTRAAARPDPGRRSTRGDATAPGTGRARWSPWGTWHDDGCPPAPGGGSYCTRTSPIET